MDYTADATVPAVIRVGGEHRSALWNIVFVGADIDIAIDAAVDNPGEARATLVVVRRSAESRVAGVDSRATQ